MNKTFSKLLLIITLISIYACNKTNDVVPNQNVIGTWKFQTASGSATVGSKLLDLKEDLVVSSGGNTVKVKKVNTWTFKDGGIGTNDGVSFTYTITGNKLSVTQNGLSFSLNVSIDNNQMTATEDEVGLKSLLDAVNDFVPNNKITKYNRTLIYRSLADILATNGTPECLTKEYSITNDNGTSVQKYLYQYVYNDENKVIEYLDPINSVNGKSVVEKITFQENKENLGSDLKPYITEFADGKLNAKYYCDVNGRVNKKEFLRFSTSNQPFPYYTDYEEYDNKGNHIKSTTKTQNTLNGSFTGDFDIYEAEYEAGNFIKLYITENGKSYGNVTKRYLYIEYKPGTVSNKNNVVFLFNYGINDFGLGNKNLPAARIVYNEDGKINRQGTYVYKFDGKGYLLSSDIKFSNGSIRSDSGYIYQCK